MKEDYKNIQSQLLLRSPSKLSIPPVESLKVEKISNIFILSESDLGVVRNGGRRGAAYGPTSIVNTLNKMTARNQDIHGYKSIRNLHSDSPFKLQQEEDTSSIEELISCHPHSKVWHLGGGHDHVYPLLKALNKTSRKIAVINLDAHLDTRTDSLHHSGTPFRQFANEVEGDLKLIQLGTHSFANEKSNYKNLPNANMEIYTVQQLRKETANFTSTLSFMDKVVDGFNDYTIILSLDCDAISAQSMEAVSAVNHYGLELDFIRDVFSWYFSLKQEKKVCGIYEYNPLFDNLSNKGARTMASLIEPFL